MFHETIKYILYSYSYKLSPVTRGGKRLHKEAHTLKTSSTKGNILSAPDNFFSNTGGTGLIFFCQYPKYFWPIYQYHGTGWFYNKKVSGIDHFQICILTQYYTKFK